MPESNTNGSGRDGEQQAGAVMTGMVKVWDPFIRIFHWTLVTSFTVAWLGAETAEPLHERAGYLAAALVAFRIVWGFVGPAHARFADFVRPPAAVLAYLRDIAVGRERRHVGHNPAGGAMVLALLATVLGLGVTGWLATTERYLGSQGIQLAHSALVSLALCLVALHVSGVLLASFRHLENLAGAMVTGLKRPPDDPGPG